MNSSDLAKAVAMELLSGGSVWLFLLTTALFAGVGAYFGKYFGTKGANLATKEDFDSLQKQLSASTRLVESVKSEIARTDWVAREWATLRIKKIEELMTILRACEIFHDAFRIASIECRFHPETPPYDNAIMISELYLPELTNVVNRYILTCRLTDSDMRKLSQQGLAEKNLNPNYDVIILWDGFYEKSAYSEMLSIAKEIRIAARGLLQEIVIGRGSG